MQEAIEIQPNHLYFWVTRRGESGRVASSSGLVLHIDNELKYEPFANDFGPLHLGCTYRFCRKLSFLLKVCFGAVVCDPGLRALWSCVCALCQLCLNWSHLQESARQSKPVIFVTSSHPHRKGNAAILLGAWLILFEGYTGEAAYTAIQRAEPFTPFRDASCGHSQFGLTVKQVLAVRLRPHLVTGSCILQLSNTVTLASSQQYPVLIAGQTFLTDATTLVLAPVPLSSGLRVVLVLANST